VTGKLSDLLDAFQGVVPSVIATCDREGTPNVTFNSQVYYVDERHVALSCQFFNKTHRNVRENPWATVDIFEPVSLQAWRMRLRFDHIETEGPLFDTMALRIQVIASHTGMTGVFKLRSADVYEVVSIERIEGLSHTVDLDAPVGLPVGKMTELRGLQLVSDRINRCTDLESLLSGTLESLDETFGFSHGMVLVPEGTEGRLVALATRGYGEGGIGAEVRVGEGAIGLAAARRRMIRVGNMGGELRSGRAIRERAEQAGEAVAPEIPLPGLADAQAQLAIPLVVGGRLLGVLALESRDPLQFDDWDEAYLTVVANQIAMGVDRMQTVEDEGEPVPTAPRRVRPEPPARTRRFRYYRSDDCVFVDGEYLVRNVPGKILWKVLAAHARERRLEFTNRELRLDPTLGLPPVKDNLESRLILLRKRLAEKCPDVKLVPVRRGRFALELCCQVEMEEVAAGT